MIRVLACVGVLLALVGTLRADPIAPTTVDLWPGLAPGVKAGVSAEKVTSAKIGTQSIRIIGNITKPTLSVYRPAPEKNTGAAVLVCPGGGYSIVAIEHEGEQVATWLNSLGVTAVVLKYRVPGRKPALQDAQRALSTVRAQAKEWGVDPQRIGVLGFSAGGHLSAALATGYDQRQYDPLDETDKVSCKPDFAVLVYPAYLAGKDLTLAPEIRVTRETPQMFFVHASDDGIGPENSIVLYQALRRAGVSAEMHIYASGGHGFGMLRGTNPANAWPLRCEEWLQSRGLLNRAAGR